MFIETLRLLKHIKRGMGEKNENIKKRARKTK
jgi:hypothetical protein